MENSMKNLTNLTIVVNIIDRYSEGHLTPEYPKYIEIFQSDLKAVYAYWLHSNSGTVQLAEGTYLVRLTLGTQNTYERIAHVSADTENRVEFSEKQDHKKFKAVEFSFPEGVITRSEFFVEDEQDGPDERYLPYKPIKWREWNFSAHKWRTSSAYWRDIYFQVRTFSMKDSDPNLQILELKLSAEKSLFVSVPVEYRLSIKEGGNKLSGDRPEHYKISIMMGNAVAQTLLSLMTRGDMISAQTLFNIKDAENLLLEKKKDPIAAAVGGYYLLKTGELEYMHNWANNLANWFEWLPDGCIIHAWQMILNKGNQRSEIEKRLLEAVERGIPVFTEGLRLLYDGLTMLSYDYQRNNREVEKALSKVKQYMTAADMSKEHTTLFADKDFLLKLF